MAASDEVVDVRPVQKVTDGRTRHRRSRDVTVATKNDEVQAGLATGTFNVAAGTPWLWAPEKSAGDRRRPVRRRGRADGACERAWRWPVRRARSSSSATPSSSTSPSRDRIRPARIDRPSAHLLGDHDAMPDDARALPRAHVATASGRHRVHVDRLLRGQARVAAEPRTVSASSARSRCAGPASACVAVEHVGAESESPEEARQVAAARARAGRERLDVDRRQDGEEHPICVRRTSSSSRRTTPRSARSSACSRPRRASGRSTSSRGRRRRSASTR